MPKVFTSETQKIGELGENFAAEFLMKQGFKILDRNYTKKWGEIDIIALKDNQIHFVEVKSVTRETPNAAPANQDYRPEDNMHPWKMKRMVRTVQTYLLEKRIGDEQEWQIDLFVVYLNPKSGEHRIDIVKDIIL